MKRKKVKIELVFLDWRRDGRSIYQTKEGFVLAMGPFHSGSMFDGEMEVGIDDMCYLEDALEHNTDAVFMVRLKARGK
jgi:hypothetical protein